MQRAAWFIKCTLADTNSGSGSANVPGGGGGGSRNRYGSGKPPSYELHDLVCKYLSSQLDKFAKSSGFGSVAPGSGGPGTPNIPSLSVNSKGSGFGKDNMGQVGAGFGLENFKTIESRNAFVSSWMYCIDFIGYCYAEGLIDQKQILKWLVEKLGVNSSNFVQVRLFHMSSLAFF
ncbi:hypothetical protein BC830DRAFT_267586 [Chytriomyces sp. MP71]|nr:hypothetical protein BC830DRAFT_267586 [Chytriomyces sp. MP71]